MKNNKEKNILRRQIMKYFIIVSVCVAVLQSMLDSVFDDVVMPKLDLSAEPEPIIWSIAAFFLLSIALLVLGALLFYRFTKKAVEQESDRRVSEQSMVYSAIAHDLKTPMTSVQGFADALRDGRLKPKEEPEVLEIISRKSRDMTEMIDDLLIYSKLGVGSYRMEKEELDIAALVRETTADNYDGFEAKGIEPEVDIPDEKIMIKGDRKELKRAIGNVIINAYKHNAAGTKVLISVKDTVGQAVITIADTGESIPNEMKEAIFEPFTVTKDYRPSGEGHGLGLATTARIIKMSGGEIKVADNIPGYTKAFVIGGLK